MKWFEVTVTLHSYWHAGSGSGTNADIDACVLRDEDNLPFVPGRTLKGLFRESCATAVDAGHVPSEVLTDYFGGEAPTDEDRYATRQGGLAFDDARLGDDDRAFFGRSGAESGIEGNPSDFLTVRVGSTAISHESGVASDGSLRVIEYAVPCELHGTITMMGSKGEGGDSEMLARLELFASMIRSLGSGRNRGFGRVTVTVAKGGRA